MPALRRLAPSFLAAAALAGLGGCDNTAQGAFAPACPATEIPSSASDRFVYDGRSLDVGSLVSHVQITSLAGDCEPGPEDEHHRKMVRTRISLSLNVTRGPASDGADVEVPYFIAIMRDGKIVDKKIFTDTFTLPPNVSAQSFRTPLRLIDLPASRNIQENPYTLEIGLQLTHAELDYNRAHLPEVKFGTHSQ